jgi:hypothetical protein
MMASTTPPLDQIASERLTSARIEIRKGIKAFFERFPDGRFENLKVVVAGEFGSFEWDFVATDGAGDSVTTAGCDLLAFRGDKVILKNAFRKAKG